LEYLEFGVLKVGDSREVFAEAALTGFGNLSGLGPGTIASKCRRPGQSCNPGFQPRGEGSDS
jgi:hypothetical protein